MRLDLPDFVEVVLGTGMRIGEAAAVRDQVMDPHHEHRAGRHHRGAYARSRCADSAAER